jgi:hypothetical protein
MAQYLVPEVKKIVVCSPTYELQKTWDPIRSRVSLYVDCLTNFVEFIQKYINEQNGDPILVILDDVSYDKVLNQGSKGPLNYISYNAVWINVSYLVICHRLTNIGSGMRENLEHLVLFQTINNKEVENLAETYSITGDKKEFMQIYRELVSKRVLSRENIHAFMYIDFTDGITVYADFSTKYIIKQGE